jgi:hypothetical protein
MQSHVSASATAHAAGPCTVQLLMQAPCQHSAHASTVASSLGARRLLPSSAWGGSASLAPHSTDAVSMHTLPTAYGMLPTAYSMLPTAYGDSLQELLMLATCTCCWQGTATQQSLKAWPCLPACLPACTRPAALGQRYTWVTTPAALGRGNTPASPYRRHASGTGPDKSTASHPHLVRSPSGAACKHGSSSSRGRGRGPCGTGPNMPCAVNHVPCALCHEPCAIHPSTCAGNSRHDTSGASGYPESQPSESNGTWM